ncbi:MAG: Asp-tRNA(Asn)/Glu-tRNA(Gln) amidotransferase subunit GatB [Chloroflexi bacterium]|nr:Asp-tRNA(Asn)/Glu-tRNA(Gln) amidotransferase subunit GatB [Chloroflexota bacterium]
MEYEVIIGMETHIELDTASKMFCTCSASFYGAEPNTNVCPTCGGMPGAMPVINARAVEFAMKVGLALNCSIHTRTFWERKSYWYPDLPKGYQVTQYQFPMSYDGFLDIDVRDISSGNWVEESYRKRVRVRRAHLEEDTGKLTHSTRTSMVDYNRSGVPLLEIVTEPDIYSADEAYAYLSALRDIVRYLGVSTGDMEKGAMRCEPNMSLRPKGSNAFGTKVEIKNLNSLRAVRESIAYEIRRQTQLLESGGRVEQVTLGWDDERGATFMQRRKEDAHDYRYFPEPDLPPLHVSEEWLTRIRLGVPQLGLARQDRYRTDFGLSAYDAAQLTGDRATSDWFDAAVAAAGVAHAKAIANFMQTELVRLMKAGGVDIAELRVRPAQLAELVRLVDAKTINVNTARQVLEEMVNTGADAVSIVQSRGLGQVNDESALLAIVEQVLAANPKEVQQYLGGNEKVFGFFVGQAMRALKGKGNAPVLNEMFKAELEKRRA